MTLKLRYAGSKIGILGTAVLMLGGSAAAQPYRLDGPEVMNELITNSISASGAFLSFNNAGNDVAELDLTWNSPPGRVTVPEHLQVGIAPMSRNLTPPSVLDSIYSPTDANVLALDAALVAVANVNGHCRNLAAALANPSDPQLAQVTTDLSVVFSGYPAGGVGTKSTATTAECAHPERLAALARLTSCQGVNRIDHILRHDDTWTTQDTFREHLQFDRWCNGKSEGDRSSPGASLSNLKNADLDPIRRSCSTVAGDATRAQSRCTYYPLDYPPAGQTCADGDVLAASDPRNPYGVAVPCTQGLIVALSETDPGAKNVTLSIGRRLAADLNGYTVGLTGLAAVTQIPNQANAGTNINSVTYEDANVRTGQYMLSRRFYLHRRSNGQSSGWTTPARAAEEAKLWSFATNRCNIRPIVESAGFVAPLEDCSAACTDPLNITCLTASPGLTTPFQNIAGEADCDSSYPCVANAQVSPRYPAVSCGGVGSKCPFIPPLPAGYACNLSSQCTSSGGCVANSSGANDVCR